MLGEVLYRALTCNISLNEEAQHGEHGQPPILYLLHLQQCCLIWVISQAQRIKWPTWVKLVFQILQKSEAFSSSFFVTWILTSKRIMSMHSRGLESGLVLNLLGRAHSIHMAWNCEKDYWKGNENTSSRKRAVLRRNSYQAIGNSVVLSTPNKNHFSYNREDQIDGDVLSKIIQRIPI